MHAQDQIRAYYADQTVSPEDRPMTHRQDPNFPTYSMIRHYAPHGMSMGAIVLVGAMGLVAYNSHVKDAFESVYFSSW
jgi:hypothetical protein